MVELDHDTNSISVDIWKQLKTNLSLKYIDVYRSIIYSVYIDFTLLHISDIYPIYNYFIDYFIYPSKLLTSLENYPRCVSSISTDSIHIWIRLGMPPRGLSCHQLFRVCLGFGVYLGFHLGFLGCLPQCLNLKRIYFQGLLTCSCQT